MLALILIPAGLLGLAVGSFINMAVWRTHVGKKWTGRSRCTQCDTVIRAVDLVPVFSFLLLRGRCHSCRKPISWQYPVVEFVTAVLFVLAAVRYLSGFALPDFFIESHLLWFLARDFTLISFLVALAVNDFRFMELPDRFTIPGAILALMFNVVLGAEPRLLLIGGLSIGGFFLAQFLFSKGRWVGDGDARLGLLMGFALGLYQGLAALVLAYVAGALVAVYLLLRKRVTMQTKIPFGAFLASATIILVLTGPLILEWYVGLAT